MDGHWPVSEASLTDDLPEDLRDAWQRIRETAVEFGEQRIYGSHHSIMFSKKVCYFFVRPRPKYLEVWIMLGRAIKAPQIKTVMKGSRKKYCNLVRIVHRDEVEAPITDWLREAYEMHDALLAAPKARKTATRARKKRPAARRR